MVVFPLLDACEQPADEAMESPSESTQPATFVGAQACADCHSDQYRAWSGSHHAKAMQVANEDTFLGDVDVSDVFSKYDGKYWARIENADDELQDFEVSYTFGLSPLQQYLVQLDGGRLQALPLAWDARPAERGGQRWFHVYGDEAIDHADPLHWTGREQNWNFMCAECHSTGLQKNYSTNTDSFNSSWAEINVACEACHGPGSRHVGSSLAGFDVNLNDLESASWQMNTATGIAQRTDAPTDRTRQPEACGRCHSRRGVITTKYEYGRPLTDTHLPSLLDERLYFPDGQILEEVYVYGSFLQSKMYQAGVTCSDCHDPHTATLKTKDKVSGVCSGCHLPTKFESPAHHHHSANDVECVDCHMPSRAYMVVDPRRDHSFRIPRPDLTIKTGSPNACTGCHVDENADWAANAIATWYGETADEPGHFSEAIHAGRTATLGANAALVSVINDDGNAGIVKATALTLLAAPFDDDAAGAIKQQMTSDDPLVRIGALRALEGIASEYRAQWAAPLLRDPVRAVRLQAVNALSPARETLRQSDHESLKSAELEYIEAQMAIAERPEAHMNLGNLYVDRREAGKAEASYVTALRMEPRNVAARANLADLFRQTGRDADAERLLRDGIILDDESAVLHHALGLVLVRSDKSDEALGELALATELGADNPRYVYVYAVALNSAGETDNAIDVLEDAQEAFPANYDISWALATMYRDLGRTDDAKSAAERLLNRFPEDQNSRLLLESL